MSEQINMSEIINKNPQLVFRTIVPEIPEQLIELDEYRTHEYDENNNAKYLQPTVPMMVDLLIVSKERYQAELQKEEDFILNEKSGVEGIEIVSYHKAVSKANKIKEYIKHEGTDREERIINRCDLISDANDITINKLWEELKSRNIINLNTDEAKSKRVPEAKRRYLLSLVADEDNRLEMATAMSKVSLREQLSKVKFKAKRTISLKYIADNDKRLFEQPLKLVSDEDDNTYLKGSRLFLAERLKDVLLATLKKTRAKLDRLEYMHVSFDDYAPDYVDALQLKHALSIKLNLDEYEILELEDVNETLAHIYAKQQSFSRENPFEDAVLQVGNDLIELPKTVFKTEYDYCLYQAGDEKLHNLNYVLEHPEEFIGVNDKSPIYIHYDDLPPLLQPTPILDIDIRGFHKTIKKSHEVRKREKRIAKQNNPDVNETINYAEYYNNYNQKNYDRRNKYQNKYGKKRRK